MGEKGDQPSQAIGTAMERMTWASSDASGQAMTARWPLNRACPIREPPSRFKPKNVPPTIEEATDEQRLMKQGKERGRGRADLIDHVFRFGSDKDIAVTGDFNGDGISSIGVFNEGQGKLDVGWRRSLHDRYDKQMQFGDVGDQPIVGDFDGDGIDEVGIIRGRQVIVDSNGNGRRDATDQYFLMDEEGTIIAGDFDGDGRDEPALLSNTSDRRTHRSPQTLTRKARIYSFPGAAGARLGTRFWRLPPVHRVQPNELSDYAPNLPMRPALDSANSIKYWLRIAPARR